jgi:hypothetical protein
MNPRQRPGSAGAAALVAAAVTGLIAFALFIGGILLLWGNAHYKDGQGYLSTGSERFASSAYAITSDDLEIGAGAPGFLLSSDRYGTIRLKANSRSGKPVFVGIAPARDVDAYLRGVAHSEVADIDYAPFSARYTPHTGARRPAAPTAQRIWAASAHGNGPQAVTWNVESGQWSVVVMNADGSRGVAAGVSAGAKVPYLSEIGYGTLGAGLLFVLATAALTLYGTRPNVPPRAPAASGLTVA